MFHSSVARSLPTLMGAACLSFALGADAPQTQGEIAPASKSYLVQARSFTEARARVLEVGGDVIRELRIIEAVGAQLTDAEAAELKRSSAIRLMLNGSVSTAGARLKNIQTSTADVSAEAPVDTVPEAAFTDLVNAAAVHEAGITGEGVTVAVLDTGAEPVGDLHLNRAGNSRFKAGYAPCVIGHAMQILTTMATGPT